MAMPLQGVPTSWRIGSIPVMPGTLAGTDGFLERPILQGRLSRRDLDWPIFQGRLPGRDLDRPIFQSRLSRRDGTRRVFRRCLSRRNGPRRMIRGCLSRRDRRVTSRRLGIAGSAHSRLLPALTGLVRCGMDSTCECQTALPRMMQSRLDCNVTTKPRFGSATGFRHLKRPGKRQGAVMLADCPVGAARCRSVAISSPRSPGMSAGAG